MNRICLCIDLKSFYASVECVDRGLDPLTARLVVADESRTDKTICLAVSPALKACGIPGRCRLFEVKQLLRSAGGDTGFHTAVPRMKRYIEVSSHIYSIYLRYIAPEDIHVYSIDEVFMDITDYLELYHMDARELAVTMIREVYSQTGITATAGIGTNLYLAKVAMDIVAKHVPADSDGVRTAFLDEEKYRSLLWDHRPLTDFWRIGRGTAAKLAEYRCFTMGDVARMSLTHEEELYRIFGVDAELLIDHAWGIETCGMKDIKAYRPAAASLCSGQVLPCPYPADRARLIVREMTQQLVMELVSRRLVTDSLVLDVHFDPSSPPGRGGLPHTDRYGRSAPKPARGTASFGGHTSSTRRIIDGTLALYDRIADPSLLIRGINVTVCHLIPEEESVRQLDLFSDPAAEAREKRLQQAMLDIRSRFGQAAVLNASSLEEDSTIRARSGQIGGHKA